MFKVVVKENVSGIEEGTYTVYSIFTEPGCVNNESLLFLVFTDRFQLVHAVNCEPINE